jgi:type III restriction enzyme
LDGAGQPTQQIIETRRLASFVTPIPKPRKRVAEQQSLVLDEGMGLSTEKQQYELTATVINELRRRVDAWRLLPNPSDWMKAYVEKIPMGSPEDNTAMGPVMVTPETARLLRH